MDTGDHEDYSILDPNDRFKLLLSGESCPEGEDNYECFSDDVQSDYSNPFKSDTDSIASDVDDNDESSELNHYDEKSSELNHNDKYCPTIDHELNHYNENEDDQVENEDINSASKDGSVPQDICSVTIHCPLFSDSQATVLRGKTIEELVRSVSQVKPEWTHPDKPLNRQNCQVFVDGELIVDWSLPVHSDDTEDVISIVHNLSHFSAEIEDQIELEEEEAVVVVNDDNDAVKTETESKVDKRLSNQSQSGQTEKQKKTSNSFIKRFRQMFSSSSSSSNQSNQGSISSVKASTLPKPTTASSVFTIGSIEVFFNDALDFLSRPDSIQEGIFRLSGTFTRINELQDAIQSGKRLHELQLHASKECHNVAGLVKQTLRKLPTCLLDYALMPGWREVAKCPAGSVEFASSWSFLFSLLPAVNQKLLSGLLGLLQRLLPYQEVTRMNASNFGTVIGPNLLFSSSRDDLSGTLETSTLSSQLVTNWLLTDGLEDRKVTLIALARMEYDYSVSESETLEEGSIIFLLPIEESLDGWWQAVRAPTFDVPFKIPSNYVSILCQMNKVMKV